MAGSVAGLMLAGGARAQESAIPPPKEPWKFQFEPSVWYGAPGGKVTLPGSAGSVQSTKLEDINLDNPSLAPGGELHFYDDKWRFMLGGYWLSEDNQGSVAKAAGQLGPVSYAQGDLLNASMNLTVAEAAVMRKIELPDSINGTAGNGFAARLDVLGGLRFYDVSFDFAAPSGGTAADEFFVHPVIGVKLTMDIIEHFTIDAQVDLGAMATGSNSMCYGYDIVAGFMWRPTNNIGVQIGYRDLAFLLRSGSEGDRFEYQGSVQGLYFGAVLRF